MGFRRYFRIWSEAIVIIALVTAVPSAYSLNRCTAVYGNGSAHFSLATGSPGELGLLKVLWESFAEGKDMTLCWIQAGSGEALQLLREKKVDMVMTHSPEAEKKAVAEGWAAKRTFIGSNEFYIVGPVEDPAAVSKAQSVSEAYVRIAKAEASFFSRGDDSGTHKKEMQIWKGTGITPSGKWYKITRASMLTTLRQADLEKGYFMTDSSTWVAEKTNLSHLKILFRGDKLLVNTYHALCLPQGATPGSVLASEFIEFLAADKGQQIIRDFGKDRFGEGLYQGASNLFEYIH